MRKRLWPVLIAMSCGPVAAAEVSLAGYIDFSRDGEVESVSLDPRVPDAVSDALREAMQRWRFEPVVLDGEPVPARTGVRLALRTGERDDGLAIEIVDARFGVTPVHAVPPMFPSRALTVGANFHGTMHLLVGEDGEVVAVHPYRVDVSGRRLSTADVRQLREQFARSAEAAMSRWRFDPVMVPAGSTVQYTVDLTLDHVRAARTDEGSPTIPPWLSDGQPSRIVSGGAAPTENVIGSIL